MRRPALVGDADQRERMLIAQVCPPEFNGAASTYRQTAPKINMCYPPLRWQTYDIDFTAAKFDPQGKKIKNAIVTVRYIGNEDIARRFLLQRQDGKYYTGRGWTARLDGWNNIVIERG